MTTQDRLDALSCTSSERSCLRKQMRDPRIGRIFDQAVMCTHDRSTMRSDMTAWRVPRTADHQNMLHTTSAIIDTKVRQDTTRDLKKWLQERKKPGSTGLVMTADDCGGGFRLTHSGKLPKTSKSSSSPDLGESISRQYVPPWISQSQWEKAVKAPPPRWAGQSWAIVSGGCGHWMGGAVLP
mmetsp:Transcript_100005/g.158290  ORF Transcript_100005/g.158290 Transcript_100005/m.158290 type:complete len:182 (-) Transcript_100005:40-585(-)|eukprot:CAMPEP_0169110384 /NCGR_PEP_ID=MMETSP1015-20121227/26484_1 /TAXON_ID=342587 /ORGANISM="Karlodinium micrum, Strain CCMP2283" /LENGTH=181 /DNA_ID=CAMNT_0009172173 /DNA_START=67 /DNA_END=612 /DNA_ORIENTATION=+